MAELAFQFFIAFIALALLMLVAVLLLAGQRGSDVKGGGLILIGPIPIVLGGSGAKALLAVAVVLLLFIALLAGWWLA
ncbi:MAG: DUF131 domain-containing protein [Aigarchaeota archaeon]|nr:DUF131 domain-containing protein [Candidatus Pelearchaeum maunauluense]